MHTGKQVGQPLQGHTGWVNSVAYSHDSAYIVSGSEDKTVRIWDAHTGKQVGQPLQGHTLLVNSVAYSHDSTYIVSGSLDETVRIWDAHTGKQVGQPLQGHTRSVYSVAYSHDSAYIVSGSDDNTVHIWDAHCAYIVSGSLDKTVRIWDAHTGKQVGQPLQGHTGSVYSAAYSHDSVHIASGSGDSTHPAHLLGPYPACGAPRILTHDGARWDILVVSSCKDGTQCYVTGAETGRDVCRTQGSGVADETLKRQFACVVGICRLYGQLWDTFTGSPLASLPHEHIVRTVALGPGGTRALTGGQEKRFLWDLGRAGESNVLRPMESPLENRRFLKRQLGTAHEGTVKSVVWGSENLGLSEPPTSMELSVPTSTLTITHGKTVSFIPLEGPNSGPTHQARWAIRGCGYGLEDGAELEVYKGHRDRFIVWSMSDGEMYATGSEDGTIRLWQTVPANRTDYQGTMNGSG
ncbi:WD40 repeat protein [Ceratobasidium sp. AG-Ba]|nr:WD40 repeat protein [Ceratobasidium sp. AG-Ba]